MKSFLISFIVGALAGCLYAVMQVRSPAPPAIALLGLLGMLVGEQLVPTVKRLMRRQPLTRVWFRRECVPKISGVPSPRQEDCPNKE
ncbi:DUF1427 family protein [Martelella alba]|uniref:DUF1427 family protein n=1 Tax=Martelella alba TaxID=2590451 RepID=A0ABY2SU12_9HYPH|nr:DUF1427 family protein [Martelella alba]TKI07829.1 DUF1427 family protein [Martelella alba]